MNYVLTVLTNGRADCLAKTLAAFEEHVTPRPSKLFIHIDGDHVPPPMLYGEMSWEVSVAPKPVGFTYGTDDCYRSAAASGLEWAVHWEDDFVLLRPLDLRDLAEVLNHRPHLAQMALVRTPVGAEVPHGGYIPQNPGQYERATLRAGGNALAKNPPRVLEWMETTRHWATGPSLIRTSFLRDNPWPLVPQSEGIFGFEVRERNPDAKFGYWGHGSCDVAHIGTDRARGSLGY